MQRGRLPVTKRALQLYSRDIRRAPRVGQEEERSLARQYRESGSTRAADRLVTANLLFVIKVASEYRSCGLEMADLIQEGNIGLMRAMQRFDPDKGTRLISYAVWWIRASILSHILRSYSLVRLGTTQVQRKLFFSLARTGRALDGRSGGRGGDHDSERDRAIARELEVKPAEVQEMAQRLDGRDLSLDAPMGRRGDGTYGDGTHGECLAGSALPQDEELSNAQERSMVQRRIEEALTMLDPRERRIIELRYMGDEPMTLKELGEHLGISAERARQLDARAKMKQAAPAGARDRSRVAGPRTRGAEDEPQRDETARGQGRAAGAIAGRAPAGSGDRCLVAGERVCRMTRLGISCVDGDMAQVAGRLPQGYRSCSTTRDERSRNGPCATSGRPPTARS